MRGQGDLDPPDVPVGAKDPLGIELVELRHSTVFKTDDADMAARKFVIHRENLERLEGIFKSQRATALRIKFETGGNCTGDFPVENEYVVSADIRTPGNLTSDCTINEMVTASRELPVKAKVLIVGDSTLTYGHASKSGNTYFAKFAGQSTDRLVPCPVLPVNLTRLGDDQEFEFYTFAISGLSAVLGLTLTPAELKRRVFEVFGATAFVDFTLIVLRIGANDIGALYPFADLNEPRRDDVPQGYPKWLDELHDMICEWCRGVAVEFDCAVAWLGAGCLAHRVNIPSKNHCNKPLHVWSYPRGDHEGRNRAYNELTACFAGMILEKSTGNFVPVNRDGVDVGRAKFCTFASQLPAGVISASGTGHPGQRHMARLLGNMLNSIGILLCKVANQQRYVTYYIENPGIPPRWHKDFKVMPHGKFKPLLEADWGNVDRLNLTKQSDWPQCLCKGDDQHIPCKRDYETRSAEGYEMTPGQLVRMKLGSGDNFVFHGGMVIATLAARKLLCVSLLDDRVHLLAAGKICAFAHHHTLLEDDKERHESREAKGGKGSRSSRRNKKK